MTATATVAQVTEQFRAGHFGRAAELAELALASSVREQRAYEVIDSLFRTPALQPLFTDRTDAARALPFYRWLVAAMESLAGHHAECVAFAQARLAAAFAVADDTAGTERTLAEMFSRGREAAALKPPPAIPPRTPTPMAFPVPIPEGTTQQFAAVAAPDATQPPAPTPTPTPTPTPSPAQPTLCPHLQPVLDHALSYGGTIEASVRTEATWIYLDHVVLYVANLVDRFALPDQVIIHTEFDTGPRPAHGLHCTEHGDAVLGAHPLRGSHKTIVG